MLTQLFRMLKATLIGTAASIKMEVPLAAAFIRVETTKNVKMIVWNGLKQDRWTVHVR